jgi:hypothetical protein
VSSRAEVIVTGKQVGRGPVVPYSHRDGLQLRRMVPPLPVIYVVPTYEVRVVSAGTYTAIRFGLRNKGDGATPRVRPCDTGLSEPRLCHCSWIPNYSPHSFPGNGRRGAWQLLPKRGFLIHEGANPILGEVGGSIGCIEIVNGGWNAFLADIEKIGGGTCAQIAAGHKMTVTIEFARYPNAVLRE